MSNADRLTALGTPPPLAKELISQISKGASSNPAVQAVTAIAAPNATDLATAQALANETKTKFNALLAALKS